MMACLRNLAIGVLCQSGPVNLAAVLRCHARDPAPGHPRHHPRTGQQPRVNRHDEPTLERWPICQTAFASIPIAGTMQDLAASHGDQASPATATTQSFR